MKKFLALLISVALVLALVAVPAAAEGEVTFTVATVNDVHPGDTVEVPLTVTNTTGVGAHTLVAHVLFDANYLTINTVTNGPLLSGLVPIIDWTTLEGDVAIGFMAPTGDGMTEDGLLLTMEFTVNDNCSLDQVLTMRVDECFNYPLNGSATALDTVGVDGAINMADDVVPVTPAPTEEPTTPPTQEPTTPPTDEPVVTPEPSEPVTGLIQGFYFEDEAEVNQWTFIGTNDTNWVWSVNNPGGYDYTEFAHEGSRFIMSYSFVDYVGAYQADNWAISPAVTLPDGEASVSFYANQANASYPETISVYVGLTPNTADMMLLQANVSPTTGYDDEWTRYELDLSDYAGETIYLAFYDNCYDCYEIWIDQVEFFGEGGEPIVTPEPTEVPQPTEPPAPVEDLVAGFYFESQAEADEWTNVDADGDGNGWYWLGYGVNQTTANMAYEGIGNMTSASYMSAPLTPDNWLISPAVAIPASKDAARVTMYIGAQDPNYPAEHFAVYAGTSANTSDMVPILPEAVATGAYAQYTADLSQFSGETVYIAVRHFNCTDMFRLNLDQVEVWGGSGTEPTQPPVEPTEVPQPTDPGYDAGSATITMGSEYEVPGGAQIVLPLSIEGEYQAHTLNLAVNYDPAVLEVVDVELVNLPEDTYQIVDYETIPGVIAIGLVMAGEELDYSGVIANITFNVADPFTEETPVEVEVKEFNFVPEATEYPVEYTVVNGVVTPVETEPTEPVVTEPPVTEGAVFTMGSEYEVPGGSVITLPFTISGEYEAHTLNAALVYDPEVLTVLDVQPGEMLATRDVPPVVIIDYETIPGTIAIGVIMPEQALTGEGTLVNVTFKVCDDFTEATPIEVVINEFGYLPIGETVEEPIEFTTVDGIVTPVGEPGPTDEPVEPTDEPVEPTDEPVEPTDEPVEPTDEPGPNPPTPPVTGAASLVGLGVMAILAGAGVVIFRRKED